MEAVEVAAVKDRPAVLMIVQVDTVLLRLSKIYNAYLNVSFSS